MRAFHLRFVSALSLIAGGSLLPLMAGAQTTVATNPVGFTTLSITPQSGGTTGYTYASLNLVRPAAYKSLVPTNGVATNNGVTVLKFPSGTFTDNQFSGTGNANYLEITNGSSTGLIANVTATTASDANNGGSSTVTLDQDLSAVISAGTTTVLIRPHWTFASAFGANNSAGFKGSFSPSAADIIQIIDPVAGTGTSYYYNTTNSRWQYLANDATNIIIAPNSGLYIARKATATLGVTLVGEVKLGQTGLLIVGGTNASPNLIPNPYPLSSVTLANSNLYTGNAATGVVGSFSPSGADILGILDTTSGQVTNYYYNTTNSRWQNLNNDASTVTIPSGASVLITRKANRSSFIWYVPQPAMNL